MSEETLYTYYWVEIENMPLDWDTSICESLDKVRDLLQYLDIYLDDPDIDAKVTIKGIGMTRAAFKEWETLHLKKL